MKLKQILNGSTQTVDLYALIRRLNKAVDELSHIHKLREAFEVSFSNSLVFRRSAETGEYVDEHIQSRWEGWLALAKHITEN